MLNDLSSMFPAHHNLNNQQLKLVWFGAGCLGYDVLET
jgi:hypothetical protein